MPVYSIAPSPVRTGLRACTALMVALIAIVMTVPGFSQATSTVIGIAAAIVGEVQIKPAATSSFADALLRQRIALADQLRTGKDSRMQIVLLDKTRISVGASARLTVDKFLYDPGNGSVSVSATKGALRFMSGSSKSRRMLRTTSATIGVRGTVFDVAIGELAVEIARREKAIPQDTRHDPETATLAVLRGPGPNHQGSETIGAIDVTGATQTVALEEPLLAAYVPYDGAEPIGPFTISLPGLAKLDGFILRPPPKPEYKPASEAYPKRDDELRRPPPGFGDGTFEQDTGPEAGPVELGDLPTPPARPHPPPMPNDAPPHTY